MATSLAPDVKHEDFAQPRAAEPMWSRAEWLWTLVGLVLLGAFLAFVVNDYPLRGLISIQ
jgi:hypothetical protein